jgi:hypothetical protein
MNPDIPPAVNLTAVRCPDTDSCIAPICPLDDWQRAQHLDGEAVCGLLSEVVKEGGEARLRGCLPGTTLETLAEMLPKIIARWARVRLQLERASRVGSKLEAGQRLQQVRKVACAVRPGPVPLPMAASHLRVDSSLAVVPAMAQGATHEVP